MKYLILIFLLSITLQAHGLSNQAETLLSSMESGSSADAVKTLNDIKGELPDRSTLELLLELWDKNDSQYSEKVRETLDHDIVRINIADVLNQAHKNSMVTAPISEMRIYALDRLNSSFPDTVSQALSLLAGIGNVDDIPILSSYAVENKSMRYFRTAVMGLVTMCKPEAELELDKITPQFSKENIALTKDVRQRFESWCN